MGWRMADAGWWVADREDGEKSQALGAAADGSRWLFCCPPETVGSTWLRGSQGQRQKVEARKGRVKKGRGRGVVRGVALRCQVMDVK